MLFSVQSTIMILMALWCEGNSEEISVFPTKDAVNYTSQNQHRPTSQDGNVSTLLSDGVPHFAINVTTTERNVIGDKSTTTTTGNVTGLCDKLATTEGNVTDIGDKPTTTEENVTGIGDKPTTAEGNVTDIGDKPTTAEGNVTNIGDEPTTTEGNVTDIGNKSTINERNVTDIGDKSSQLTRPRTPSWCKSYDSVVAFSVGGISILGTTGNIISVVVLARMSGRMSNTMILSALAISDSIFLVLNVILRTIPVIFTHYHPVKNFYNWFIYIIIYGWPSVTVVYSTGTWVTVLVTLHRYIVVCQPHHALRLCRPSLARRQLLVVVVLNVAFALPLFFDSYAAFIQRKDGGWSPLRSYTWLGANWYYQFIYRNVLYFTLMYAIPLLMLFVMVVKLINALRQANQTRSEMTGKDPAQEDITKILISIVVIFLFSQV